MLCIFGIISSIFFFFLNDIISSTNVRGVCGFGRTLTDGAFQSCDISMWRCIFTIPWSIWKKRNDRIFKGISSLVDAFISAMVQRKATWFLMGTSLPM